MLIMTRDTSDMFEKPERGRFGDNEQARPRPRVTGASDLHDLALVFHHETRAGKPDDGALLASIDGHESKAVWLPKSQIEFKPTGSYVTGYRKNGQAVKLVAVVVTLPEWLAVKNGLL